MENNSLIFAQRDHWILIRGWLIVFLLSQPLVAFASIMGGAAPNSPGFLYTYGLIIGMILSGTFGFFITFKIIDSCLTRRFAKSTFSYFAILLTSFLFMIYFNIFEDNLFQIKQGNYDISIMGLIVLVGAWAFIIALGNIWFRKSPPPKE